MRQSLTQRGPGTAARILLATLCLVSLAGCEFPSRMARTDRAAPIAEAADPGALAQSAKEAYDRQDWTQAERHYVALTTRVPADAEPWFRLGNIYARTLRGDLAIHAYREAVQRDPKHVRAWHNMGIVELQQAVASFAEIDKIAAKDDPLYQRSTDIRAAVQALITPHDAEGR